jgi:hypothetical protein
MAMTFATGTMISGLAAKAGLEFNILIADQQAAGRVIADVEHDLAITHKLHGHLGAAIHTHGDMRRQTIVGTPFKQSPQQIRTG